jgi:hypothetical protein
MKVIISEGLADGRHMHNGMYLASYDPEALDGMGAFEWTRDPQMALRFPDAASAWVLWKTTSKTRPTRDDGKPNRPLTAYTVAIEDAPEVSV